jgi:enoyl-[acyl-carrier protein] reductase II
MDPEELSEQIDLVKARTQKPFGVNIPIIRPDSDALVKAAIGGGANVIFTSAGSPKRFTKAIHDAGLKVVHITPSAAMAEKAAAAGVDAVVAEGIEAGGHNGFEEIATMALVPQVAAKLDIPVIAAGGIADSRGFVAALALGAQGVQVGTRFAATQEARGHVDFKNAILTVKDTGTVITGRAMGPTRCVKNKLTEQIHQAETGGAGPKEIFELIGVGRSRRATLDGDVEEGTVYCGQIAGLIVELKTAAEVIEEMMEGGKALAENVADAFSA